MSLNVLDLREFYANPLGDMARRVLRAHVRRIWSDVRGETVLALGYSTPLLPPFQKEAGAIIAVMFAHQGADFWPRDGKNVVCCADASDLPLPDLSVDRIIVMHALEEAVNSESLLREAWRVLKSEGRALIIAPNRRGLWARNDSTPFGMGTPYSAFQLKNALKAQGFAAERVSSALYFPPSRSRRLLNSAESLEKYAGKLLPGFGGVLLVEARKQVYAPILTKSRVFQPTFVMPMPFPEPTGAMPATRSRD